MRRHPSCPDSGSGNPAAAAEIPRLAPAQQASPRCKAGTPAADNVAAADTEDGDSDSDGADGVSDDAQDDMQDEVMAPAAPATALPRGRLRTYTPDEQAVMRELNISSLTSILSVTLSTGAVRWSVKLSAEGLQSKTRPLHGELSPKLRARLLIPYGCGRPGGMCV
jgi:hypothetical protein